MSLNPDHPLSDSAHALIAAVFAGESAIPPEPLAIAKWVVGLLGNEEARDLTFHLLAREDLREELVTRRTEWEAFAQGERGEAAGPQEVQEIWRLAVEASLDALSASSPVETRLRRWGTWMRRNLQVTPPPTFAIARSAPQVADAPRTLELTRSGTLLATAPRARSESTSPALEWRDALGGGIDLGTATAESRAWRWEVQGFGEHTGLTDEDLRPELFRIRKPETPAVGTLEVWSETVENGRQFVTRLPLRDWPEVREETLHLPVTFTQDLRERFASGSLRVSLPVLDLEVVVAENPVILIEFGLNDVRIPLPGIKGGKITSASIVILTLTPN